MRVWSRRADCGEGVAERNKGLRRGVGLEEGLSGEALWQRRGVNREGVREKGQVQERGPCRGVEGR